MKRKSRLVRACVLAVILVTIFSAAEALADNYGAIAYCGCCDRWGWAVDYGSRAVAESCALSRCNCPNCEIKVWFYNSCGAVAKGDQNALGYSWGFGSRSGAESRAVSECAKRGPNCEVICWACTTR